MKAYKTWILLVILLSLVFLPGHEIGSAAEPPPGPRADFVPGELLVRFEPGLSAQSASRTLGAYGATRVRALYKSEVELWQVPTGEELALEERLSALPYVAYAEPNYLVHALDTVPNDPFYNSHQWAHDMINSAQGWDITTGDDTVTIAIIDSGIDGDHPDLNVGNKIVAGYDFIDDDSHPNDTNGHGTHVAGIAAAATDNGIGIAGTSWGARIMPLRILNAKGSGNDADLISAINWAVDHGADIINLSLGGIQGNTDLQNAIRDARDNDVLVIAAAGNCGASDYADNGCDEQDQTVYPAAYPESFAVAATNSSDATADFSNRGDYVDIAAPGVDITSTYPDDAYANGSGTSQATPHVAGLAALLLSVDSTLTPDEVQTLIEQNAVDRGPTGWDPDYGHGRIDIATTLQALDVLGAPTLDAISNSDQDGTYVLSWSSDSDATEYRLQEDDNADFTSPQSIYTGSNTQYTVTNQTVGTWYYRVQAANDQVESAWSNVQSTSVVPAPPALDPILNPGSTYTATSEYTVTWSAVAGATGYALQEALTATFTDPLVRYVGEETQYQITGQRKGTWHYRVRAIAPPGHSDWSNTESTTVMTATLGFPTLDAISNADEDGEYAVTWSAVPSATTYTLEESADGYFIAPTQLYHGPATQVDVTDQDPGTWYYRVRAHTATDSSPWSIRRTTSVKNKVYLPLVMRSYVASILLSNSASQPSSW